jgi:TatD DNase family protein
VDSHCHLPGAPSEADATVDAARAEGVAWLVCVGTDLATSRAAVAVAERRPDVRATVGLHPHDAVRLAEEWDDLVALAAGPTVVAVGECGLDYHYDHSPRDVQREVFAAQIELAHRHDLALVIHTREAWDDTFAVLADAGVPPRTVFHCFSGGPDEAERCLALGAHLSFSGIVTFPSADDLRAAAQVCPLDRLLVETDSPYLAPVPHRGARNRPALVAVVGAAVAAVKDTAPEAVAEATWASASRVYGL